MTRVVRMCARAPCVFCAGARRFLNKMFFVAVRASLVWVAARGFIQHYTLCTTIRIQQARPRVSRKERAAQHRRMIGLPRRHALPYNTIHYNTMQYTTLQSTTTTLHSI